MNSIISVLLIIVTLIRLCKLEEKRKQTPRTLKKQICNEIPDFDAFKRYVGAIFGQMTFTLLINIGIYFARLSYPTNIRKYLKLSK